MNETFVAARKAFLLGALLMVQACTTEKVVTVEKLVPTPCSADAPTGSCAAGESCFEGACTSTASLCSATNLAGTCPANTTCFSGGCVISSALCGPMNATGSCSAGNTCVSGSCVSFGSLCSPTSPTGTCPTGRTCTDGACVAASTACSTSNPTGSCPTGQTCTTGICVTPGQDPCKVQVNSTQPTIGVRSRAKLTIDGKEFKDSNGNGTLDPYEDWRLSELCRARDLVSKMTIPQKVGLMSEGATIGGGTFAADGGLPAGTLTTIETNNIRQALIRFGAPSGEQLATYLNAVQARCEALPHGIPFIVTADPVHGMGTSTNGTTGAITYTVTASVTPWPYPWGLGAANDIALTREYGDTVRREFKAMGFRWQLGPMADLSTEPRWARVQNTFGESAYAVAQHSRACIEGFQGFGQGGLKNGIAATVKHFPGAGPDEGGKDSHSRPGRFNVYPGNNFQYHQIPFQAAFAAGAAAVMPCYSIFKGQVQWSPEQTGSAYSHGLITRYMKQELGFAGMVTADWGVLGGSAWGMETLTGPQRVAVFLRAGAHQLGNDSINLVQQAFDQGLITTADIDGAATMILEMTFKLGAFENPYVDPAVAAATVRSPENLKAGLIAQKKAMVILKNRDHTIAAANGNPRYLPIDGVRRATDGGTIDDVNRNGTVEVYYDGVTDELASSDIYDPALGAYDYTNAAGATADGGTQLAVTKVATAALADIAVMRITARKGVYMGLDQGVPLSFDGPFTGTSTDSTIGPSLKDRNKVIDLLRVRDGYTDSTGAVIAPTNPNLKIILVMHMDRPGIVKPFVNGLTTLNETSGVPGSYPLVSDPNNIRADGLGGVDGLVVEFGAYDRAVLDVMFNRNVPTAPAGYAYGAARLPAEIPSADSEVSTQFEDVPADTANPTYLLGAGGSY